MADHRVQTLTTIAERNHGLITVDEVRAAGVSPASHQEWIDSGRLVPLRRRRAGRHLSGQAPR